MTAPRQGGAANVVLEVPAGWFRSPLDGDRHRSLYVSLLVALSELDVTVQPLALPYGADTAERDPAPGQVIISYHSRGPAGDILRLKESYVPPYYTIDREGYSGFSELATSPERFVDAIAAMPLDTARRSLADLRREVIGSNLSKYPQPEVGGPDLPDGYIFMPLQTMNDPVATLWRLDPFEVLRRLLAITARTGQMVVVKRHPLCKSRRVARELAALSASDPRLIVADASVHRLIAGASAVVGANTGVLFEALVHGKPVISFGGSDFAAATTQIATLDDLAAALAGEGAPDPDTRDRFLGWYLTRYCVRGDDIPAIKRRISEALTAAGARRSPTGAIRRHRLRAFGLLEELRRLLRA